MLDKYENFYKLSKISQVSVFSAFNRKSVQNVLITKVKNQLSWNEVLCHKQLQIINKLKIFPKMHEIFRFKGYFFFVFQKTQGDSLSITTSVERHELPSALQMMTDLLEGIQQLLQKVPGAIIYPEWIYFHRNSLRLLHYEPFLASSEQDEHKTIFAAEKQQNPEGSEEENTDYVPGKYRKSLIFQLGLIAYRLLTGKKEQSIRSQQDYENYVRNIRQNCQRQIVKYISNEKIANFISKMISEDSFQVPNFIQVYNTFQNQNRHTKNYHLHKELSLEVELQKIQIGTKKAGQKKRRVRNCCIPTEPILSQEETIKNIGLSSKQLKTAKEGGLLLPYVSLKKSLKSKRQNNFSSMISRHKPILTVSNRKSNRQNHFKSEDHFRNEFNIID